MVDKSGPLGNNSAMSTATKQEEEMSPDAWRREDWAKEMLPEWGLLSVGEVVQDGDEALCSTRREWDKVSTELSGWKVTGSDVVRRRLRPDSSPTEEQQHPEKPWTLPTPPAGMKWHREDWEEAELPQGWRPLLDGELPQRGDLNGEKDSWAPRTCEFDVPVTSQKDGSGYIFAKHKTPRPLPQSAEPVVEEKSALTQYWQDTAEANLKEAGRERTRAEQAESERDRLRKELEDWRSDRKASSAAFRAHIKSTTAENAALKENLEAATHLVRRAVYAAEHLRDLSRCPGMVEWLKNADAFLGAQESPPETEEQAMRRGFEECAKSNGWPIIKEFGQYTNSKTYDRWQGWRAAKQSIGGRV